MNMADWLEQVREEEIPYELKVLEDPQNEQHWTKYIDFQNHELSQLNNNEKHSDEYFQLIEKIVALYYRKYIAFGEKFEDWLEFIKIFINLTGNFESNEYFDQLNKSFLQMLDKYGDKVEFWTLYFDLLFRLEIGHSYIEEMLNICLMKLTYFEQFEIWEIILKNYKNDSKMEKFKLYTSFFVYLKNCIKFNIHLDKLNDPLIPTLDEIFDLLLKNFTIDEEINIFETVFNTLVTPKYLLKSSYSELDKYSKYFEKLIELAKTSKENKESFKGKIPQLFGNVIKKFPDQKSKFAIKYSKYLIKIDKFDESIDNLNSLLLKSTTISDFTLIFDSLTELLETKIASMSEDGENNPKLIAYVEKLENLINNRLVLLNDVKLRQNINCPSTWLERLQIFEGDESQIKQLLECYSKAVVSIDTKKIPTEERLLLPEIWVNYAKIYYEREDLLTTRSLFETATKVPWTELSQLEFIWIEWIKLEIKLNNIKHATYVCSTAVSIPQQILNGKVGIDDEDTSMQMKLFKSVKLWCLYLDLLENSSTFENVCKAYEEAMELKVINGVMIINYCLYLEEKEYYEKSFSIFERGLNLFTGDSKSILYSIYLNKILSYWDKLNWDAERVREIFETGLDYYKSENDIDNLKQVYVLYSEWEVKYGSKIRCLRILKEGIEDMNSRQADKLMLYKILIINTIEIKGVEAAVPIFIEAVDTISVQIPGYIGDIIGGFVKVEVGLGEITRARSVLQYAVENIMEFNKSDDDRSSIWELFKAFELENGDENSYKNMLRLKRYLENLFGAISKGGPTESAVESTDERDHIGFVVSSTGPKVTTHTIGVSEDAESDAGDKSVINEDAIELDMDMDEV